KEQEDRDAGLLHGRPDRVSHLRGGAGPRRRGRLVSRRRTRHRPAEQSAFAGREEQGAVPDRDCLERRSALAERKERAQGDLRKSQIAGRDRSLLWGSRLVPAGFARLQRTGRRKGVEAAAGAVRQGAGLVLLVGTARTRTVPTATSPSGQYRSSALSPRVCFCFEGGRLLNDCDGPTADIDAFASATSKRKANSARLWFRLLR